MKVYAVQLDIVWEEKGKNYDRVRALLAEVSPAAGSLIVLPEMFATGFSMNVEKIAEEVGGETEAFLGEVARQYASFVIGGVVTRGRESLGRNESVVVGPSGELIGRYCKIHPFSLGGEDAHFESGEAVVTLSCGEFVVAPLVCYDLRFPEVFRMGVREGATLFVVIANWPSVRAGHWRALLVARAIENQAYVVGVNRCGVDPNAPYSGVSMLLDPKGLMLCEGGAGEEVLCAEMAVEPLLAYRRKFPALSDMRSW